MIRSFNEDASAQHSVEHHPTRLQFVLMASFAVGDYQDGAVGVPHNFFGNAANQEMPQPGASVRTNYDEAPTAGYTDCSPADNYMYLPII